MRVAVGTSNKNGTLEDTHSRAAVAVMASEARGQQQGGAPSSTSAKRLQKQRRLCDVGFRLLRAGNVDVPLAPRALAPVPDQPAKNQYADEIERRRGILAVPPWRNPVWLQRQPQQRGGSSTDASAAVAGGSQTAAACDSDTAVTEPATDGHDGGGPSASTGGNDDEFAAAAGGSDDAPATSGAAASTNGGGGRGAGGSETDIEDENGSVLDATAGDGAIWHRRTNSPRNVFAAVACTVSSAHPDGVAVQCLACPTFNGKGKAGEPRLYKFGPFGGNRANCRYDVGHFVFRHLRSTKHQQSWAAFFERTMRVLPRGEALPSARPAAPLPLTHLDVMRHTHAKDFEITSSTWLCRRCGHQGTFNASTTPGSLLSHLSSARCDRLQPVRVAASRFAQFFVVPDSVKRRRAVELRFPRGAAVRIKQPDGTLRRASVLSTTREGVQDVRAA